MADPQFSTLEWCIYALIDPRTHEIRYIGKSKEPEKRFGFHVYNARRCIKGNPNGSHTKSANWIISLLKAGHMPIMSFLAESLLSEQEANLIEIGLIATLRKRQYRLTNLADGGEGTTGLRRTPEQIARMSAAMRGRPHILSPEGLARMREVHCGPKTLTPEQRQAMSVRSRAQALNQWANRTEEQKREVAAKTAATQKAKRALLPLKPPKPIGIGRGNYKKSPEHIRKIAEANRGNNNGAIAKWGKPGERERMSEIAKKQMAGDTRLAELNRSHDKESLQRSAAKAMQTKRERGFGATGKYKKSPSHLLKLRDGRAHWRANATPQELAEIRARRSASLCATFAAKFIFDPILNADDSPLCVRGHKAWSIHAGRKRCLQCIRDGRTRVRATRQSISDSALP